MMFPHRRPALRRLTPPVCALVLSALTLVLSGCGSFFSCEGKSDCPATGTTGTNSGNDWAYVSNSATGSNYLNGYSISSTGALTAISGSPFNLDYIPQAMAITPNNSFLYIANDSALNNNVGYLYGYSLSSTGAPSILNGGKALESESIVSIDISADGAWLFCLDADGSTIEYYSIDSSTGALTYEDTVTYAGAAAGVVPHTIKVAPSKDFVAVALGTGGLLTFPFDDADGGNGPGQTLYTPPSSSTGIYGLAIDANNNIYASGTAGLQVFTSTTTGVPTLLQTYPTDAGPYSVAINSAASFVYTGNEVPTATAGSISAFSIATGPALTALSTSPYTAPEDLYSIGIDNTNSFLLAAGLNASSGLQLYSIASTGALTPVSGGSIATGTSGGGPAIVVMSR